MGIIPEKAIHKHIKEKQNSQRILKKSCKKKNRDTG
jgi:hypothetical protein